MYIMHIIHLSDTCDNQVVEVQSNSRHGCIDAYLKRNAWARKAPNSMERLPDRQLLVDYDDEVCILQAINEQVITAKWVWKSECVEL